LAARPPKLPAVATLPVRGARAAILVCGLRCCRRIGRERAPGRPLPSVFYSFRFAGTPPSRRMSISVSRVAPQLRSGVVDPADIGPDPLAVAPARYDEVRIVGLRALQVVDHQVAAVRLDRGFEPLDGREQVRQVFRALGARHGHPAIPQAGGAFGRHGTLLVRAVRVEAALELFIAITWDS